jgi:AP-1 complex subunit gamma-1
MSIKLRDLIRSVRACKTAAEERAVISKECALIRTAIKEEEELYRHRNVAKLMYIHMLGYPTHFGQMECLKLISAQSFPEKRIGYLGLTLLLTEQTEVLTLVTNSLKMDLSNSNQYIQALSLVAIGNLATQDMARDLASDVDKILRSSNSYLRKKASLAAIRLLKKEPDLIEQLGDRIVSLLKDKAHGVLITGLQLMIEVLDLIPDLKEEYQKLVPSLVRLLRNFISMGFSPEHDVAGITDPFMQVKLLHILKRLGKGSDEASDQMNDVLAQVATNTETAKNAGNAILYECVQTIMEIESDSGLRVLAVNILGRFLLNRDNNIRYVALNSLSKVVSEDISAVQRHRATIVECLKDGDISIRQRALELIYQLVNDQNVVFLTAEMLNYLVIANTEQKASLVSKIMQLVEKYSPSKKWRVDTVLTMLSMSGNQIDESVPRNAIIFIAQSEGLQGYAAHRLFRILKEDTSQQGLLHVAVWCVGEYSDLLVKPCPAVDSEGESYSAVAEFEVVAVCDKCLKLYNVDSTTKGLILNSLMKLAARVTPAARQIIKELIAPYRSSMSLELQQRSAEYSVLLDPKWDSLRGELMGKMPVLDEATLRKRRAVFDDSTNELNEVASKGNLPSISFPSTTASSFSAPPSSLPSNGSASLLDLDDIFGGGGGGGSVMQPTTQNHGFSNQTSQPHGNSQSVDLLSDIFSTNSLASPVMSPAFYPPAQPTPQAFPQQTLGQNLGQNMGQNLGQNLMQSVNGDEISLKAFDKGGLQVKMCVFNSYLNSS